LEQANGKLRLVLRSKKLLTRVEDFDSSRVLSNSLLGWNGQVSGARRRIRVYEYVFDERQLQALREARELSERTGLILEVTDLSQANALRRVWASGLGRVSGRMRPRLDSRTSVAPAEDSGGVRPLVCQP